MTIDPKIIDGLEAACEAFYNRFMDRPTIRDAEEYAALMRSCWRVIQIARVGAWPPAAKKGRFLRAEHEAEARGHIEEPHPLATAWKAVTLTKSIAVPLDVNNGRQCGRCFSDKLVNRGGGCLLCMACGFDLGCNG